jgi:hypothetical protein
MTTTATIAHEIAARLTFEFTHEEYAAAEAAVLAAHGMTHEEYDLLILAEMIG